MKYFIIITFILIYSISLYPQTENESKPKKILNHTIYDSWKRIEKQKISNSGEFVSYEINPARGNGFLYIYNTVSSSLDSVYRGTDLQFSPNSKFVAFKLKKDFDTVRILKIKKKKPEELLKDTLILSYISNNKFFNAFSKESFIDTLLIRNNIENADFISDWNFKILNNRFSIYIPKIKNFLVTQNEKDWVVFQTEKFEQKSGKKKVPPVIKEGFDLTIFNPHSLDIYRFKNNTEYSISKNGNRIIFVTLTANYNGTTKEKKKDDSQISPPFYSNLYVFDTETKIAYKIFSKLGSIKKPVIDESGSKTAFLFSDDTSTVKRWELWCFDINTAVGTSKIISADPDIEMNTYEIFPAFSDKFSAIKIADSNSSFLFKDWEINENGNLMFSKDGKRLFFGTAPKVFPLPKDTIPEDEKVSLDIWNWNDPQLQTRQLNLLELSKKKTYRAVYYFEDKSLQQISDTLMTDADFVYTGNSDYAFGYISLPYEKVSSYIIPEYQDIYSIDMKSGIKKLILSKQQYFFGISSSGKYGIFLNTNDSSYYSYNNKNGEIISLTKSLDNNFTDEENDRPRFPDPYGIMGWSREDKFVYVYDKYDIFKIDPNGIIPTKRLTSGRESKTIYRFIDLDPEEKEIPDTLLLKATNESTLSETFLRFNTIDNSFENLYTENAAFLQPLKSKSSNLLIWQKMTYEEYPDLLLSDINFKGLKKISNTNPEQSNYNWGKVRMVYWQMPDSTSQRGLLYVPENFDESKKYPMIVYFYEKYSDKINSYYSVTPSRSVINFPLYNSNGYIIFIPDINYKIGYPGKSAYDAIMSGTESLCKQFSFIDKDRLGLQGQSWGGYQVAYLVTQTNLFKAAMAGAPVSNMLSAYAGIRWESGLTRIFQYEADQSRIGKTIWEGFELYKENSPLFYADKISTPLLIMSNDNDGAVPWQQGIELFVSLRRLEKPSWMLTYNGDEHNLVKWPNRVDLSIRMKQFFDVYLKNAEIPLWMIEGIPALKKGLMKGY